MSNAGGAELLVIFGCCVGLLFPALFLFFLIMALTRKSKGWIIAAVVSGIITLLTFIGGIVFAVTTGVKEAKKQAEPRSFTTSDGLATVTGAPQWRELAIGSADASLGIGNQVLEQYLVVVSEPRSDFPEGYTLAQFAEIASEQAFATLADAEVTDFAEVSVGGMKGLRREAKGSADGLGIFYLNTYLESPTYFHQVMAWTLVENEERYRAVLETAADTFREVGLQLPE
jgi:hypothetical protein